jgi:hypothetical protein
MRIVDSVTRSTSFAAFMIGWKALVRHLRSCGKPRIAGPAVLVATAFVLTTGELPTVGFPRLYTSGIGRFPRNGVRAKQRRTAIETKATVGPNIQDEAAELKASLAVLSS